MSIFDGDDYIDDNYNPYIDNYKCKRGYRLNIKSQWCCFECERERMNDKYTTNYNHNYINYIFFSDDDANTTNTNNNNNIDPLKIYWEILKLIPPKTLNEVKKQYHKLCKVHHPDKGGDSHDFIRLKNSYDKLICSF